MSKRRIVQQRKTEKPSVKKESKKTNPTLSANGWNSMSNWLVVLVFVLPILFSRETLDPAITPRYIFLGSFLLLFLLFFYVRKKVNFVISNPVKIVFALGTAYGLWSILSLFYAINPSAGYYETARHFLNLILLFFVFVIAQNEEEQLLKICKAILVMSLIQSFVGIVQYYELGFDTIPGSNAKPFGLMANRNLFGSAQALVLPFVIWVLYKAKNIWKYVAAIALSGIIVSLVISQTRSAWLASVSIMITSFLLILLFSKENRKKWIVGLVITITGIVAVVALLLMLDKENSLRTSVKERAVSLTQTQTGGMTATAENVNERVKIWKKTIELIKDKPLLGAGIDNWKITIPAYGTQGLVWAKGAYVPDRAHNVYLQVTSEAGIPGGVLYFSMWLSVAIVAIIIITKKSQSEDRRVLAILMLSGLCAFAVDCMFSFPTERIEHSLYVYLMAGIIIGTYFHSSSAYGLKPKSIKPIIISIFLIVIAFNIFIGYKKYNFEKHMIYAKAYESSKKYEDVLTEVEAGKNVFVSIDPNGVPLEQRSAIAYKGLKDYENALKEIQAAQQYNPHSTQTYNNMGTIYTAMKNLEKARESYLKALLYAPENSVALRNLAGNYFNTGNYAACIEILSKIKNLGEVEKYIDDLLNEAKRRLALQSK